MAEAVDSATTAPAPAPRVGLVRQLLNATEVDVRLVGMLAALAIIWIGFGIASNGLFLSPRNLWNLSVQTATIAILANGMVLIIVTRNIDLSVGSLLGFLGMIMAVTQVEIVPDLFGNNVPLLWLIAIIVGLIAGVILGALQGFVIAYLQVPAFIVTLAGLLVWRGAAYLVTTGRTVAPLDVTYQWFGGGADGSIGPTASWVVGVIACIGIIANIVISRRQRQRFNFPLRPVWAEVFLAVVGCVAVLGAVAVLNAYPMPINLAKRYAAEHNIPWPENGELTFSFGISVPVIIAILSALVMAFVTRRTRFGRYVFAIGGNPEAAVLGGINVRWIIMLTFVVMGILCTVGGVVATARLNAATAGLGTNYELYTIAAAVIGGTSFAGGIGTISGAMLGALVMQSLQSGMELLGIDTPLQNVIIGIVLVIAVGIDTWYRRRTA
ncbi:MAG TPA: sugar ABC transporter permease [Xanthobacteraceae bacterium]|nr:sugar ABC transporter permease [Xanthobacteraceae bacterium]